MSDNAARDKNFTTTLLAESSVDNTPVTLYADPTTHRLLVDSTTMGTVTSVSVVSANGFAGTVATATTTPAITLSTTVTGILKGNGTAISAATNGTDYLSSTTGLKLDQTTPQTVINGIPVFNAGLKSNALVEVNLNSATISHLTGTGIALNGADNTAVRFGLSSYGIGGTGAYAERHARGTGGSPSAVQNGDRLVSLEGWGYGATGFSAAPSVAFRGFATETWTDAAQGSRASIWTTPNTTVIPVEAFKVGQDGVINIPNLTATKVVFTDASKNLTSTGIGTSSQFIKGDGSLDSTVYGVGTWTDSSTSTGTNKTLNSLTNYIDSDATHVKVFLNLGRAGVVGDAVYISGWNAINSCVEVGLARANSSATMPAVGLLETAGNDGTVQEARVSGVLSAVNTNAFSTGTALYVSPTTAGALTSTKPTGTTQFIQRVGNVALQAVSGQMMVIGAGRTNDTPTVVNVAQGGTGVQTLTTAYGLLAAGTTATGSVQTLSTGSAGQALLSGGSAALPAWSTATYPSTAGTSGNVVTSDGTNFISSAPAVTTSNTITFTNKRITPRILSAASYTTDTGTSINGDTLDMFIVTAQTGALKFNNPTGTPTDGQKLIISVASSTTSARALTWDTAYGATTVALPTTTAATTATLTIGFIWSASKSLWQCVAVA